VTREAEVAPHGQQESGPVGTFGPRCRSQRAQSAAMHAALCGVLVALATVTGAASAGLSPAALRPRHGAVFRPAARKPSLARGRMSRPPHAARTRRAVQRSAHVCASAALRRPWSTLFQKHSCMCERA
jgi:hypothetical protein